MFCSFSSLVKLLKCKELYNDLKLSDRMAISSYSSQGYSNNKHHHDDDESSSNSKSNVKIRRYTSAPSVNKSQNVKHTVNFERNNLKQGSSGTLSARTSRTRSRSGGSRRSNNFHTSDTESTEGNLNTITIDSAYYSSRSVPDLNRSNLNFRKLSASPRHLCPCHLDGKDEEILSDYYKR